jgi:hypothetical protein
MLSTVYWRPSADKELAPVELQEALVALEQTIVAFEQDEDDDIFEGQNPTT